VIFVTVGNFMPFPRLIEGMADLKARGAISDDVVLQVARMSDFRADGCRVAQFIAPGEFERLMRDAHVVVTHGGCGTIIQALRAGKVPVVMPRQRRCGEHVDDHQVELARALAAEGRIVLAMETSDLGSAIAAARVQSAPRATEPPRMVGLVRQAIEELLAARAGAARHG
jgi:UDP-N-acetylglucosamine transferase subunit ALG13